MNRAVKSRGTRRVRFTLNGLRGDELIEILAHLAWLG
jgi:hypothetical protein